MKSPIYQTAIHSLATKDVKNTSLNRYISICSQHLHILVFWLSQWHQGVIFQRLLRDFQGGWYHFMLTWLVRKRVLLPRLLREVVFFFKIVSLIMIIVGAFCLFYHPLRYFLPNMCLKSVYKIDINVFFFSGVLMRF